MLHMTIGVFGNHSFAKKLGKEGTTNDIAICNHGSSEGVFTFVSPNSEKIQSLLQVINMIDVPIIVISELNAQLGEEIIAIAEYGFEHGFIVLDGVVKEQIDPLIKGTCIENFKVTENVMEDIKQLKFEYSDELLIPIDNYFDVKSVGTVILGIMKGGKIKKYDKVNLDPLGKEVMIKGIQSQDKDFEEAEAGMRVGLNLKGITVEDLKRGYIIGKLEKTKTVKLNFEKSKYTKEVIKENDPVFVSSGLQVVAGKVKSVQPLEVELENELMLNKKILVASTKQNMPRILGKATL